MPARSTSPTPYADINALLNTLLSDVQMILGGLFVGMYVHGSLANGDFDPQRSDIDFVVVTTDDLPGEMVAALEAMHASIAVSNLKWATNYEGSYIPQHALRRYDPDRTLHPAVRVDGSFGVDRHGSEWVIQRHVIREQGIVLAGPAPQTLIDPVPANDLRRAALGVLREWWAPQLRAPFRLHNSEYHAYAVLTMCRVLYTLEFGTVASKPQAARWTQKRLGGRWVGLIDQALSWQHGVELDGLNEVLDFIRYTLERSEHFAIPSDEASGILGS